jgi:gliding motility-associated lipoprotein GldH
MACQGPKPVELYYDLPEAAWTRFNTLRFELPVTQKNLVADVFLIGDFTEKYEHNVLNINMIMKTPSGEERINEYEMKIRTKEGVFEGEKSEHGQRISIVLKRQLNLADTGRLIIDIENLVPRLRTEGVRGIGIRLVPVQR